MALSDSATCSQRARDNNEPIRGTASWARAWLLIENHQPWPSHAVNDALPADLRTRIAAAGWNAQFVREFDDRSAVSPFRVWFADAVKQSVWLWQASTHDEQLSMIEALLAGAPEPAQVVTHPFLLVCTNGKRDACCAVAGREILSGLAHLTADGSAPVALESTHLGGHRFAGVVVSLPHSYQYRCHDSEHAQRILDAARQGIVEKQGVRGHTATQAPEQVAELAVREALNVWKVDTNISMECAVDGDTAVVRGSVNGSAFTVTLVAVHGEPRPESCGGDAKPLRSWTVVSSQM